MRISNWIVLAVVMTTEASWSLGGCILDMSHTLEENAFYWPGFRRFEFEVLHKGAWGENPWLENNAFCTPEHMGTHIDAPAHFSRDNWHVDEIPLNRLIAPAIRVDVSQKAARNPDYQLTVGDLQNWEMVNGRIQDGSVLFFYTGWGLYWSDRLAFTGSNRTDILKDEQGNSVLHFPGCSKEAADWLVQNRNIYGFATELPSLDYGPRTNMITHQILLGARIYILENVANMDQLPTKGSKVFVLPLKIKGGSGSPVRVISIRC